MEDNRGDGGGRSRSRGRGGGRSRYRPYVWRGRGRGGRGGGRAPVPGGYRGRGNGSRFQNQNMMMPPPTPRVNASRNSLSDRSNWGGHGGNDAGQSRNSEGFGDESMTTATHRRKQQRLDSLVLSQLAQKYPGYHLYFSSALASIPNLLDKIDITVEYLKRHQLIPDVKAAHVLEEKEYFDITHDRILEDEEFLRVWPSFDSDLVDYPEDVINIWGISMHTLVHNILTAAEDEDMDETECSEEMSNPPKKKTKFSVPYIQARLMKVGPVTSLKAIKSTVLGKFVTVRGAVIRTGTVKPHCGHMTFKCSDCIRTFVVEQPEGHFSAPSNCYTRDCLGKSFEALEGHKTTQFEVSRKIRIQDMQHDESERGAVPRSIDCVLKNSLQNICNAGDAVTICGIVKVHKESGGGFGVTDQQLHQFYIDVVAVRNHKDSDRSMGGNWFTFSNKDFYAVQEIHDSRNLFRLLVASLCPTIFGHDLVKAGLLLCLFGGSAAPVTKESTISRRSDINVLIVGDPGLGKSQMLGVVSEVAPRGVYVCGTATSVAGLTVTLVKDGDDYSLEAGALVMADRGTCCIDEFDKMQAQHSALLEAMEQQSISIAKSGVFRILPARTSVIAAANPVGGHYDARKSVAENIRINPALLSRFDLTFILVDRSDEERDRNIVNHILGKRLHGSSQSQQSQHPGSFRNSSQIVPEKLCLRETLKFDPSEEVDLIPHHLIRKYIAYARQYVSPVLSPEAAAVIKEYYLKLRVRHRTVDATPVTTRQLESLLRLTQARAKLELREIATEENAKEVLEIFEFGMAGILEDDLVVATELSQLVGNIGSNGTTRSQTKAMAKKLLSTLQRYAIQQNKNMFTLDEIKQIGRALGIGTGIETLVSAINTQGFLINKGGKVYQLQSVDF